MRLIFIALTIAHIGCKTYFATGISTQKERAWASERTAFWGITLSERLYYCYAEEKKSRPVCIEAEFVSAPEE
jgi:hypothetical protein